MTGKSVATVDEKAREIAAVLLRQASTMKQSVLAELMDCSEATVSRRLNEDIDKLARLLVSLDLRPVKEVSIITDLAEYKALRTLSFKYLELRQKSDTRC